MCGHTPRAAVRQFRYRDGLAYAQLHGDEGPAEMVMQRGRAFKALRPATLDEGLASVARFDGLEAEGGPGLLVDAFHPSAYGGAGQQGDWALAAALARRAPRMLLAGGLTPDNVAAAIQSVGPWGVVVSSGVEKSPSGKDHDRFEAFMDPTGR